MNTGEDVMLLQETINEAIVDAFEDYTKRSCGLMPPSIQVCCNELRSCVEKKISDGFPSQFEQGRWLDLRHEEVFFEWCFPEPTAEDRAERLYRAYEIFRRCAAKGWESAKLIRPKGQLNCIPYPPENLKLEGCEIFNNELAHLILRTGDKRRVSCPDAKAEKMSISHTV